MHQLTHLCKERRKSWDTSVSEYIGIAVALACAFPGFWLIDTVISHVNAEASVSVLLRISSLMWYVACFVGVWCARSFRRSQRSTYRVDRFLRALSALGVAFVVIGYAFIAWGVVIPSPVGYVIAFVVKAVGAPLTIGIVLHATRIPYRAIAPVSAGGMAGAFVLYILVSEVLHITQAGIFVEGAVSVLLIGISWGCFGWIVRIQKTAYTESFERIAAVEDNLSQSVSLLESSRIIDIKIRVAVAIAALSLGFLSPLSNTEGTGVVGIVGLALVALAVMSAYRESMTAQGFFKLGIMLVLAGLMVGPLIELVVPSIRTSLIGSGVVLSESAIMAFTIIAARKCNDRLEGAALMRVVAVSGHLLGSLLAELLAHLSQVGDVPFAADMTVAFVYALAMLFLLGEPLIPVSWHETQGKRLSHRRAEPLQQGALDDQVLEAEREKAQETYDVSGKDAFSQSNKSPDQAIDQPPQLERSLQQRQEERAQARTVEELLEKKSQIIAQTFRLTKRETDVLIQLAQGRDLAYMEEYFVLSRNTIKMHIKHIYEKTDVHSKQAIIDLVARAEEVQKD